MGVSRVVSALVVALVVVIAAAGAVSYLYAASNSSGTQRTSVEISTVTVTSTTTQTVVIKAATSQENLPTNLPKTCITNYPNGLNLNNSNYFIITNFTMNFAQVCIKYIYGTNPNASSQANGGRYVRCHVQLFIDVHHGQLRQRIFGRFLSVRHCDRKSPKLPL